MTNDPYTTPMLTEAEVDVLIARAGLAPDADLRAALQESWKQASVVTSRVRRPRAHAAEPAHVFVLPVPEDQRL